ncbi:thioesterase family protein [Bacterioplanoides sp.]|uniref:thioesterase family protein n=1 Tax=Bacterioplanoides sp. TaxID=2066072 RepID=UPI003AFF714C
MIQLIRYLMLLAQRPWKPAPGQPRPGPLGIRQHEFWVMPWDCDLNLHLTNGRYPAWLDLMRTRYFIELGATPLFIKQGWRSVLASQTVTFIREIKPFAKVQVTSELLHWDRKYLYLEHKFLVAGQLHAVAIARVALLQGGRVRSLSAMLDVIHGNTRQFDAPSIPDHIQAKIDLLEAQKAAS